MSADPVTLAIGGAAIGGMLDKKNPLRGAALGGLGGYFGGPLLQGLGAGAAPAGGAVGGTGLTMGAAGANGLAAPAAPSLMTANAAAPMAMPPLNPMAQGMGAQGLQTAGAGFGTGSAASMPFSAKDMIQMGGKMMGQGQQEQRPMAAPAAPMQMPQGQQQSFASISPYAGLLSQRRIPVI